MRLELRASNHMYHPYSIKRKSRWISACFLASALGTPALVSRVVAAEATTTTSPISISEAALTPSAQSSALITLDFSKAPVSDILTMIGREGNVDIVIGEDVTGTLKSVHLTDKTADQAIRMVAQSAGVPWKKMDTRTYLVGKAALPDSSGSVTPNSGTTADSNAVAPNAVPDDSDQGMELLKPSPKTQDDLSTTASVALRNVKPSIMAYWLDPSHQTVPLEFQKSQEIAQRSGDEYTKPQLTTVPAANNLVRPGSPGQAPTWAQPGSGYLPFNPYTQSNGQFGGTGGSGNGGGSSSGGSSGGGNHDVLPSSAYTVALPQGVDNLIAVDAQNVLLVRGTDEGIDRIREIIGFLDRPVPQVEIEAQFVSVNSTASKLFALSFTSRNTANNNTVTSSIDPTSGSTSVTTLGTSQVNVGVTRGNVQAVLQAAETAGVARTLQAPRVTTFNNLTAQLTSNSSTSVPIVNTTVITNVNGNPTQSTSTSFLTVFSGTTLTVIPTINRDGTITISLQPQVYTSGVTTGLVTTSSLQQINTSANIKDGDTLAIGGLRMTELVNSKGKIPILGDLPLIGRLFRSSYKVNQETELIIFVTAHVVRHIDDPVAGT